MYKIQNLKIRLCIFLLIITVLVCFSGCKPVSEQKPQATVERIQIQSDWIGDSAVDFPTKISIDMRRKGSKFIGFTQEEQLNGLKLPIKSITSSKMPVAELLDALQAKPQRNLQLNEVSIHPYQLQSQINSKINDYLRDATPIVRRDLYAYRASLFRNSALTDMLSIGYKNRIGFPHDYPNIRVRIYLSDGKKITAESNSWMVMMLPWNVNGTPSFSTRISKAVAVLLPNGSINRDRLLNPVENMNYLSSALYSGMNPTLNRIVFDRMVPNGYRELSERFIVSSLDFERYGCKQSSRCFRVTLRLPTQPENLRFLTHLTIVDRLIPKADIEKYYKILQQVNESSYIQKIRSHPDRDYLIYGSFGQVWSNPELVTQFVNDMTANGKIAVIPTDLEILKNAVLVRESYDDYWVIFSNHRTVQWMRGVTYNQKISGKPCFEPPNEGEKYGASNMGFQCVGEIYNVETTDD